MVDVTVTTAGGTLATGADDEYTFVAPLSLTITNAGTGSGSVSCNGGVCVASYPFGTKVTFAASSNGDSIFVGWSGGGCSGTGSCTLTIEVDTAVTATFDKKAESIPPPEEVECKVPKLRGLSLGKARSALGRAYCKLGKVSKPKGKKLGPLVVKSSSPAAGALRPEGTKVNLKLGFRPKK
jgi:hypothetical protein